MSNDIVRYYTMRNLEGADKEAELAVLAAGWAPQHFAAGGKVGEPNEYARHFAKAVLKLFADGEHRNR